jgi:peptide deformylase
MRILQHTEIINQSKQVTDMGTQAFPYIKEMAKLCNKKIGRYKGGMAVAHCQVEKDNPYTFFVMANGNGIINPIITDYKESGIIYHLEGCLSYKNTDEIKVKRYKRIKVDYTLVTKEGIFEISKWITDIYCYIMQHEIDHFNLKYIYPQGT